MTTSSLGKALGRAPFAAPRSSLLDDVRATLEKARYIERHRDTAAPCQTFKYARISLST